MKIGKLIVLEGLDGSGKSTQWEMLKKTYMNALFVTFPDYNSYSGKIIQSYLGGEFVGETAYAASSFYAVDRYISCQSAWGQSLKNGKDIICARYTSSNAVYQMSKLPENEWESYLNWLYDYEFVKLGIPKPDLTIFLDVPLEVSQKLLAQRYKDNGGEKDIHEGDLDYLKKCKKAADFVAKRDNWKRVNCMDDTTNSLRAPVDISNELIQIIEGRPNDRV